jgi:hypothetical protein
LKLLRGKLRKLVMGVLIFLLGVYGAVFRDLKSAGCFTVGAQ